MAYLQALSVHLDQGWLNLIHNFSSLFQNLQISYGDSCPRCCTELTEIPIDTQLLDISAVLSMYIYIYIYIYIYGARGSTVGWGTALQVVRSRVRFPMVSLEFFIDVILPTALWPRGLTQPLTEMSARNISWGVKAAGAWGWQPYHPRVPIVL